MNLRKHTRKRNTKFLRHPGTRGYLGNNKTRIRNKSMEENDISTISNQLGYFCLVTYSYPTYGYASSKHAL
jgi:hypothetical protein